MVASKLSIYLFLCLWSLILSLTPYRLLLPFLLLALLAGIISPPDKARETSLRLQAVHPIQDSLDELALMRVSW